MGRSDQSGGAESNGMPNVMGQMNQIIEHCDQMMSRRKSPSNSHSPTRSAAKRLMRRSRGGAPFDGPERRPRLWLSISSVSFYKSASFPLLGSVEAAGEARWIPSSGDVDCERYRAVNSVSFH